MPSDEEKLTPDDLGPVAGRDLVNEKEKGVIEVQGETHVLATAVTQPESVGKMPTEDQKIVKARIVQQLENAMSSQKRVEVLAKWVDIVPLDTIVGWIMPGGSGDVLSSTLYTIYLLFEAKNAGLTPDDMKEIFKFQLKDFAVGFVLGAVPLIDLVGDYLYKSNKKSLPFFQERTRLLLEQAERAGVEKEIIERLKVKVGLKTLAVELGAGAFAKAASKRLNK